MFSIQLLVIHVLHSSKSFVSVNQSCWLDRYQNVYSNKKYITFDIYFTAVTTKGSDCYNYIILFNFVTKYFKGDEEQISRNYVFKFLFCYCTHTGIQVIWDEQQSFSLI